MPSAPRIPILYLAPWVDYGGSDKGTIDWFRWLDRDRFAPSLVTTQPSSNRRLAEIAPYAEEVWALPDLLPGADFPDFIFDFIDARDVRIVHIMNSRLGFDLLPDLGALPHPPAVVVQLHVEEEDRSGYVRYVTTRYGNLVDAFSLTSEHLARAVIGYGAPPAKCHVIHTGVDASGDFSPERVAPIEGLASDPLQILYPGRLVEQKDPELMVRVAVALRRRGVDFRIHVVGEGELEPRVRELVGDARLEDLVRVERPTDEIARWYASSDVLLMTSRFEGVPYVAFEAMAMALPVVAPRLPGNVELMAEGGGVLIEQRDDADAYAEALAALAADSARRAQLGAEARERMLSEFSLAEMGRRHGLLYEDLAQGGNGPAPNGGAARRSTAVAATPAPIRLRERPARGNPLVSVIIPCFNHGRYLPAALESVHVQSYSPIDVVVVDDCSTDPDTVSLLERLAAEESVTVVRLPANVGPSAARNAALAHAKGRYVLPLDADNVLLPRAVEQLSDQLRGAGERIGFIYPNLQYFGTRDDYWEAPEYNLYALLQGNYCDTGSLLDRQVFDAGVRYAEEIRLGHEDWDFALALAEREVYGEPSRYKSLLYRKWGFTRSDAVEYASEAFADRMLERHRRLYDEAATIKSRWSPALSLIALAPFPDGEARDRLMARLAAQTAVDVELLIASGADLGDPAHGPPLRRIPDGLAGSPADALLAGTEMARGRWTLATSGTGSELLADPAFTEKLLRVLRANASLGAIVLAEAENGVPVPLRLIGAREPAGAPHAVVWSEYARAALPAQLTLRQGSELEALAEAFTLGRFGVQWRHAQAPARRRASARSGASEPVLVASTPSRGSERSERASRLELSPQLPGLPRRIRRWRGSPTWVPPECLPLCRHLGHDSQERIVTTSRTSPAGFALEFDLGSIRRFHLPGTRPLIALAGPDYAIGDENSAPAADGLLGFVETAPLPLLEGLTLAFEPASGRNVLVSGSDDPIADDVQPLAHFGFIEPYPIHPRTPPHVGRPVGGLVGLVRGVDRRARRHTYAAGELPAGELAVELGALAAQAPPGWAGAKPLWVGGGGVATEDYQPTPGRPASQSLARWALAPLAWADLGEPAIRARAAARRAASTPRLRLARAGQAKANEGRPAGWLFAEGGPARVPLYSALHPATGDQLLTRYEQEARDLGYVDVILLGYLLEYPVVTESLEMQRTSIPWASRFGRDARWQ
ncbi:MAG TPA: glycosyltransferase [Solirubrobacteraceae bacterium]|nr:glycosyltransferase [Solirubrobacteraceae bacterium]